MIEEIEVNEEELEGISFVSRRVFDFPAVTIMHPYMNFNVKCAGVVEIGSYYKAYKTPEYIVLRKCAPTSDGAIKMSKQNGRISCSSSSVIEKAQLKRGTYKLYKCKDGVCFKRYERLVERDA